MSHNLRVTLIILVIFCTLVFIGIIIHLILVIKRNYRIKIINKLQNMVKTEILLKADRVIIQIKKIVQQNHSYLDLLNKLRKLYDQIENSIDKTKRRIADLKLKYQSLSFKKFNDEIKKIRLNLQKNDYLEAKFSYLCHGFMNKDEFLRSEMVFLKNALRTIISYYQENKSLLSEIATKIDVIISDLNQLEHDFDNALNVGEIKAASGFLHTYENKVYNLALIVNEGSEVKSHIFHSIPQRTQKLITNFDARKQEAPLQFNHIDISLDLDKLVKQHRQARTQFELLSFEQAKKSIKKCHEMISVINQKINAEIKASNFFTQIYNHVIFEISKALQRYVALRKKYRILLEHTCESQNELTEKFEELKKLSHEIDDNAIRLKTIRQDVKISFSSKLSKLKIIMHLLLRFVDLENEVEKIIWLYNVETIIYKNKFQKIESAINELIFNIREQSIIISQENNSNLEKINDKIIVISQVIYNEKLTKAIKEQIDNLVDKVTQLYSAVGGDLQIAEITKNMIQELSIQRLGDERLSYVLTMAEKDYMIGKYSEALNNIITFLGERVYA